MGYTIASLLLFFGTSAFIFWIYNRLFLSKRLTLIDYLGIFAFLAYVGETATVFFHGSHCGFAVHQWDLDLRTVLTCSKNTYAFPLTYTLVMMFAKPAILAEWVRIFVVKSKRGWFFWLATSMAGVYVIFYFVSFFLQLLSCVPVEHWWKLWVSGKCIDIKSVDVSAAYVNLVCATGRVVSNTRLIYPGEGDTMHGIGDVFLWAYAESTCVLLVFCVPAMPKVFMDTQMGQKMVSPLRNLIYSVSALFQSSRRSNSTENELQEASGATRKPSHPSDDDGGSSQVHLERISYSPEGRQTNERGPPSKGILRRIEIESHDEQGHMPWQSPTQPPPLCYK